MLRCVKIVIFVLVLILFSVPTLSNPTDKLHEDLKSAYDLVPEMFYEISGKGFDKDIDFNDYLSDLNIIKIFIDLLTESFFKYKNEYLSFVLLIVIVFIYQSLGNIFQGKTAEIADIVVLLLCGISVFEIVIKIINGFIESYVQISGYISSVSVSALASMSASGYAGTATVLGSICTVFISVYNHICNAFVFPFSNTYLALAMSGGMTGDFNLRRISVFIRNFLISILAVFLSFFSGLMSVQSVISMNKDTLFKKTVKQIVSSGFPVLGGFVSDGLDTFFTTAVGVKNSIGILGITVSVILSLAPISELLILFFVLSAVCFVLSFFENFRLSEFINTVRDLVSILICVSLSVTILTVLLFYFIIKVS